MARLSRAAALWESAWSRPAGPEALIGVRAVLALHALWFLLSRPDLPQVAEWPAGFWAQVPAAQSLRFGLGVLPAPAEWALFALLHLCLVCAALGVRARAACCVSAALLYHFAPTEEIFVGMPHTFFGGLTLPTLGLAILGAAELPRRGAADSPEYRWPVVLIRALFSFNYFSAFLAKLRFSGPLWFTGGNIANWAVAASAMNGAPAAPLVAESPLLCWTIALSTGLVEMLFPLAAFSRRAALVLVPLALLGHIGIVYTLGIFFPSVPLLLLYVDWDRLPGRSHARRQAPEHEQGDDGAAAEARPQSG